MEGQTGTNNRAVARPSAALANIRHSQTTFTQTWIKVSKTVSASSNKQANKQAWHDLKDALLWHAPLPPRSLAPSPVFSRSN